MVYIERYINVYKRKYIYKSLYKKVYEQTSKKEKLQRTSNGLTENIRHILYGRIIWAEPSKIF